MRGTFLAVLATLFAEIATVALPGAAFAVPARWTIGTAYRSLDVQEDDTEATVRQLAVPISISFAARENVDVVLVSGANRSTLDFSDDTDAIDLSGAADTKVKATARLLEDRLLLSAGVGLPTGKREYSLEESEVARALSQSLFGFRYKNLGEGLDIDLGAALARSLAEGVSAAVGAGYLRKGAYTLLASDSEEYDPGDEITLTGGVDVTRERVLFRGDLIYRLFGTDEQGDRKVFAEGNRLELEELLSVTWPRTQLSLRSRQALANESELFAGSEGQFVAKTDGPSNLWSELRLGRSLGERWGIEGILSYARLGESEIELGDGHLAGFGGAARVSLTEPLALRLGGQILKGKGRIGDEGPKDDVSGFEILFGLSYESGND